MDNHIECPGNSATIRNAVFGLKAKGVPDEIADKIRKCDTCFVSFYGDHLSESFLMKAEESAISWTDKLHFENCMKCRQVYRKHHPLPNKMGRSHPRYVKAIS